MQKIEISRTNVFEERANEFANSKLAHRLQDKYKARPYEERRKVLFVLSQVGGWICNGLAVVASASFVFGFCYSLLAKVEFLPYPTAFAVLLTLGGLVFVEGLKRATVPDLFKDVFQYGFKGAYFVRVFAVVFLVGVSTFFSFKGGHEFVELVMHPPTYAEPTEKTADAIRERYKTKISDAKKTAETYRQAKLWHGRLSDDNATEYKRLLDNAAKLENEENAEIQALQAENREAKRLARVDFEAGQKEFESKLQKRGSGFAGFSIFGEILFLLFAWFVERYDYKTATQYAVLTVEEVQPTTTQSTTTPQTAAVTPPQHTAAPPLFQDLQQPPQHSQNGQAVTTPTNFAARRPIGFYTQAQRTAENLLQQPTQAAQSPQNTPSSGTKPVIVYDDRHTILHKGQKVKERYTLARVRNYQKTYAERERKARGQGKPAVADHNAERVKYWQEREAELLEKVEA